MSRDKWEWFSLEDAAKHFGYSHHESLRRRIRQLRKLGFVVDIGKPPAGYAIGDGNTRKKVVIMMWPNPKTALMRSDAPSDLLNPKRGKPTKTKKTEGLPKVVHR